MRLREPLGAHEAGEAGCAHAALAFVSISDIGMLVELAAEEPRFVHAAQCVRRYGGFSGAVTRMLN